MNPYDFIPLGEPSRRQPAPGHDFLARSGGTIRAQIETLGPFLIAEQNRGSQNAIRPLKQGRIIPGSSIKGMLRTLAEIVGGACISLSGSLYQRGRYSYAAAEEPRGFAPCENPRRLCSTCRMFGMLHRSTAWKGLIEPGEAVLPAPDRPRTATHNVVVGQPKPSHSSFYVKDGKIRGRKAYYPHPDQLLVSPPAHKASFGARQTIQLEALEPGQRYEFTLRHQGLDDDSYALLLYAMFLEGGLAHKLGWGKPMGFGSVRITPISIEEIDLRARYRRGGDQATTHYGGGAAEGRVSALTGRIRADQSERMTTLRRILAFPGPDVVFQYPKFDWFKDNPKVSLEEFNAKAV